MVIREIWAHTRPLSPKLSGCLTVPEIPSVACPGVELQALAGFGVLAVALLNQRTNCMLCLNALHAIASGPGPNQPVLVWGGLAV